MHNLLHVLYLHYMCSQCLYGEHALVNLSYYTYYDTQWMSEAAPMKLDDFTVCESPSEKLRKHLISKILN